MLEMRVIFNPPQVLIPYFNVGISLEFLADGRVQFIKAAAARGFHQVPGIPPENRYEKEVEIPVCLVNFVPG